MGAGPLHLVSSHNLATPLLNFKCFVKLDQIGNITAVRKVQCQAGRNGVIDNLELVIGDSICLLSYCTYKQIAAVVTNPAFPGWLSPLKFNPLRFEEFASLTLTLIGTWVCCAFLTGGYRSDAASNLSTALQRTSLAWLASMPVAASQLVLLVAAEDKALVGTEDWAKALPLAASGPGEPFVTAAGVLGLMVAWRAFYTTYLDQTKFLSIDGARLDREADARHFSDALKASLFLAGAACVALHFLSRSLEG